MKNKSVILIKFLPFNFWKLSFWQQWFRVSLTNNNVAVLNPRQIYILPTRWGLLYGVMLLALLIGSINYSLSLGYFITFLLTSLGNIAMLHTWRNIVHLQIEVIHAKPVFAGDTAYVSVKLIETKNRERYAVAAHFVNNAAHIQDVPASSTCIADLALETQKRGYLPIPRITFYTEFPLSLFNAWAVVENPFQVLVYAKPSESSENMPTINVVNTNAIKQTHNRLAAGDDEFSGHRRYQVGDAKSQVDWKASTRGNGIVTKQFSTAAKSALWLDWDQTQGLAFELRVSQLTRWVIDAHKSQQNYGLKLPTINLVQNNTQAHYHQALTALALLQ